MMMTLEIALTTFFVVGTIIVGVFLLVLTVGGALWLLDQLPL